MYPSNAVAAASHVNPYPWYQQLLAGPALHFDPHLRLWIASRATAVQEVMDNPHCLVRPSGEAVPRAFAGSSAGAVFGRLIRMNDGPGHARPKQVIGQALAALDPSVIARRTAHFARLLGQQHGLPDGAALTRWTFDLPTWVVADLLGLGQDELPELALWVADFVRCLSPLSTPSQLADASVAAQALQQRFARLVQTSALTPATLLDAICRQAAHAGWDDQEAILANLIGLLSQTHEASAGLIGNSIVALLDRPQLEAQLRDDPQLAGALVQEVARFDPPIQNTRRFVAQPTIVAGVALQPGDTILLLLAAAGRDAHANPDPDVFVLERPQRRLPGFGHGPHACPGQALATRIATTAIQHLLALPVRLDRAALDWTLRPSANARLPQFFTTTPKGSP
ncbi:cytochrome P450 [Actimicrobium sp. GrIS 1.19]|uniref:cytochrome P450 n=1 Tax=Actimicrobium sp. GrIS 1.19 TaxID=3071708 RepID=UPI002DF8D7C1|nr:cytochrome P450 [Actimicrobium sp. GrIS 1.19]